MRNFFFNKNTPIKESPEDSHKQELLKKNDKLVDEMLFDSEMHFRQLFESAQDGILILDFKTGNIVDANPFIIKIIDCPLEEVLGKKLWEIGLFSDKEEAELAFIELKANGYVCIEDMPVQRRNGKKTGVEFVGKAYLVSNTKLIQSNISEITERKLAKIKLIEKNQQIEKQNEEIKNRAKEYSMINAELIESLNRIQKINDELIIANNKAKESFTLKTAFLDNMSHEIRTPMNAIMGFSEFLLRPELSKEKLTDFVQIIQASSLQLLTIINDIIDISKLEAGQITIDSELFDINKLLNELFVTYKKLTELKKLSFYYSCKNPDELVQIKTDKNRIKQVLCNLLNNAIKFTKKGKIEFGYRIKKKFIEFYVKDTGIGIMPENQELIFQRFRQVEITDIREYGGNGLGLSISKALIEKLGGTIKVNSKLGIGSTFIFTIPYLKGNENINSVKTSLTNQHNWNEKTILLVEDEVNSHAYLEEFLSGTNIKLRHAWDGKEAIEEVKNHTDISLVLMDIKMPILDGFEATQQIKQIRSKLPIIAQTAYAHSHERKQARKAGCDDYLVKPIDRDLFEELLNRYLS